MNEQKNDKWLDEIISRTINTEKPQFDTEKWKQKFPDEFRALQSLSTDKSPHSSKWLIIPKSSALKFAAAAVIILAIGLFIILPGPGKKTETTKVTEYTKSAANMQSAMSLNIAFRRGGMEAVERQSEEAIKMLGPRPAEITVKQMLSEFNGT
jgi:hypothetical protein